MPIVVSESPVSPSGEFEGFVLDGLDLNQAAFPGFSLTELRFTPAKRRPEWAENADADGELLVRDPKFTNAQWDATVEVRAADRDAAQAMVGQVTDKLVEASRVGPLGIPLVHTPADSTDGLTWYVLMGEVNEIPITWESGYFSTPPVLAVSVTLTCRPFGYGPEVTVSAAAGSGPVQIVSLPDVPGDVSAEGRLIVTDTATQSRDFCAWGLEQRFQSGADLLLTQPDLTATGFSGTSTTRAGSVSTNVYRATLTTSPVAVCGTGNQPHVGTFRDYLRFYPTSTDVRVRLSYREGDGPLKSLNWEAPVAANAWNEIDLGVLSLPEKVLGTQRWQGQFEAYSTTAGDTIDIDYAALIPAGEGYGRARRLASYKASTALSARDEFDQSAGNLTGKTAPVGGTWAGAGDADDFSVGGGTGEALRGAVSDADANTGRYAVSGASAMTDTAVQVDLKQSGPGNALGGTRLGVLARYTDTSNWLMAVMGGTVVSTGSTTQGKVNVYKRVSGTVTLLGTSEALSFRDNVSWRLRLQVDAGGHVYVWAFPASNTAAQGDPIFSYSDSALATGGALASGKPGFYDAWTGSGAATRTYDNFQAFAPPGDAVVFSGQSIEFRWDGDALREDSTGTYWGKPTEHRGGPFLVPPAGDEDLTTRVAVMARRGDPYSSPINTPTDNQTVEVRYTPRYLYLPR